MVSEASASDSERTCRVEPRAAPPTKPDGPLASKLVRLHRPSPGRPLLLRIEWTEVHPSLAEARAREQQLKGWSHAKKQALIDGNLKLLNSLARGRKNSGRS